MASAAFLADIFHVRCGAHADLVGFDSALLQKVASCSSCLRRQQRRWADKAGGACPPVALRNVMALAAVSQLLADNLELRATVAEADNQLKNLAATVAERDQLKLTTAELETELHEKTRASAKLKVSLDAEVLDHARTKDNLKRFGRPACQARGSRQRSRERVEGTAGRK